MPAAQELQEDVKKRNDRNRRRVEECLRFLDGEAAEDHAEKKAQQLDERRSLKQLTLQFQSE